MLTFTYSAAGLALTKGYEGLSLTAYRDVAGIWTIGYGHTGPDVYAGLVITEAQAEALLLTDMKEAIDCVNAHVLASAGINQHMFDAMVDFTFNAGRGNFLTSHILIYTNERQFQMAAAQFGLWVHAGGKVEPGLVRRRKDEATLYLTPVSS